MEGRDRYPLTGLAQGREPGPSALAQLGGRFLAEGQGQDARRRDPPLHGGGQHLDERPRLARPGTRPQDDVARELRMRLKHAIDDLGIRLPALTTIMPSGIEGAQRVRVAERTL